MCSDLKFHEHIGFIVRKADTRAGIILKSFISRDICTLKRAFEVYVRPILETNSEIFNPCYCLDIDRLESCQRRFTKRLPGLADMTYAERLKALAWDTLELRRVVKDLVLVYKIVNGYVDINPETLFEFRLDRTRGHARKIVVPLLRKTSSQHFFAYRVIKMWNRLPMDVVNAKNPVFFREKLMKVKCLFTTMLRYSI